MEILKKNPTEVVFSGLLIWFFGKRGIKLALGLSEGGIEVQSDSILQQQPDDLSDDLAWVEGVGKMHVDQVRAGQDSLYRDFGISFVHYATEEDFYKRLKEDLVSGFAGIDGDDSKSMTVALLCYYMATSIILWFIITAALAAQNDKYREMRANPLATKTRVL